MSITVNTTIVSSGTLSSGTWLIIGTIIISGTTANGQTYAWIGDNSNAYATRKVEAQDFLLPGNGFGTTISYVGTGVGPFLLCAQSNGSAASGSGTIFCTRLA